MLSRFHLVLLLCIIPLFAEAASSHDHTRASVDSVVEALGKAGLETDPSVVSTAAANAVIATVDPGGRLLSPAEAQARAQGDWPGDGITLECWPGEVVYLEAGRLSAGSGKDVVARLNQLRGDEMGAVILDLRGAYGSDLDSVVDICGHFVEQGTPLFSMRDVRGRETGKRVAPAGQLIHVPVALLIDEKTTGTAELLAAVLRSSAGVLVLGRTTSGDAGLRETIPLPGGSAAWVAVGRLVPARGATYDSVGVKPHVVVERKQGVETGNDAGDQPGMPEGLPARERGDYMLERALDVLAGLKAVGIDKFDR